MPFIPKPPFPNLPKLPGVPQLTRSPAFPPGPPPSLGVALALGRLWQALFSQPQWAIYKHQKPTQEQEVEGDTLAPVVVVGNRRPVVTPDSFLEFGYRNESTVSDYPVQDGGFATYDKVQNPYEAFVRMAKGGSKQDRKKFLDEILAIQDTIELYDILTPEKTFLAVNVLRFEISRRGNRGAYFFTEIDLYFREIREVTATYSNTSPVLPGAQDASAKPVANVGTVQPQPTSATPDSLGIQGVGP